MALSAENAQRSLTWLGARLSGRGRLVRDYLSAISGAGGRLVFSLVYFVVLANALPLADFGVFATASGAGVMLSRILAFGFISALYRVATVRPRLIGAFTAGFLMLALVSLPVLAAATCAVYALFFAASIPFAIFAAVIAAEAIFWRPVEAVMIVNNGMGKFGRASVLAIIGTAIRAAAALIFMQAGDHMLSAWTWYYLGANAFVAIIAFSAFYPRQRLRLRPRLYWRRLTDSLAVAGSEILFYLQMEFDKLLVLAIGGANLAGVYAVIMRLVDLTAIPIRTFSMMLVQTIMRSPAAMQSVKARAGIEAGIFTVSTLGLCFFALVLHVAPNALGHNIAAAAGLVGLAILIPGCRNIVEYHAELLYARGQTVIRAINLALLAGAKAVLLIVAISRTGDAASLIWSLNAAFVGLYLVSAMLTYTALRRPAKPI